MPAPGKKPATKLEKAQRGTLQPSRDGVSTLREAKAVDAIGAAAQLAIVPPPLPADVADVWADYVQLAIANGARECDRDTFAEWCTMTANLRKAREAEAAAPASYVAQWRMLGELFGLAGPGSRAARKGAEAEKTNPFARNGPKK